MLNSKPWEKSIPWGWCQCEGSLLCDRVKLSQRLPVMFLHGTSNTHTSRRTAQHFCADKLFMKTRTLLRPSNFDAAIRSCKHCQRQREKEILRSNNAFLCWVVVYGLHCQALRDTTRKKFVVTLSPPSSDGALQPGKQTSFLHLLKWRNGFVHGGEMVSF